MVKKLFKHELKAHLRVLLIVWLGLLGVALLARCVQFFEQDSTVYDIVNVSSIVAYTVAVMASIAFPLVLAIVRFYRNLFTGEGYLSFTLPVTPFQHIWVKLAAAVLLQIVTGVVMLLSVSVITAGEVLVEIWNAGAYLFKQIFTYVPELKTHLFLYIAEFLVWLVVLYALELLLYYTCISVGQLSKKNRILTAVGVYFGYYFACQILQTIWLVVISLVQNWDEILEPVFVFAEKHPCLFGHLFLCGAILLTAGTGVVYFAITHTIIRKRLNLE